MKDSRWMLEMIMHKMLNKYFKHILYCFKMLGFFSLYFMYELVRSAFRASGLQGGGSGSSFTSLLVEHQSKLHMEPC